MRIGLRSIALAAAGCACIGAAAVVLEGACIVVPPPDLGVPPPHRPTILHASVDPPTGRLMYWPPGDLFSVPVEFEDPTNDVFVWDAFVDTTIESDTGHLQPPVPPPPSALDGGVMVLRVKFNRGAIDLSQCHHLVVYVAHAFAVDQRGVPQAQIFDSIGGDTVDWSWVPPNGCRQSNGGDAMPPVTDGASDVLPVPPGEAGSDP